ncbi:MAG: hypothetical protein J6K31_12065 [Parabacteroides sp.]|nr:hypothetical protein [Parabacteroides sp.]
MKKTNLISLFLLVVWSVGLKAQESEKRFFFKNFQETYVIYNDGRSFCIPANYDLVKGTFVFIDKQDGDRLKYFGEQEKITSVKVGERTFLSSRFGPTEIIQTEPAFKVYYKPRLLDVGKSGGYGTTSHTSATRSYSHLSSYGGNNKFLDKETKYVHEIEKVYIIQKDNKEKQFSTPKQFLKLYPQNKKELQEYITENQIDFKTIMPVLKLYNHAEEISR